MSSGIVRERKKGGSQDINPDNFTKACQFIRPMLGHAPLFYGPRFYNCYVSVNPNLIYIAFKKPLGGEHYEYTLDVLKFDENFIKTMDFKDYLIYVYEVPEIFEDDFYNFLDSKYSKFTDFYKEEVLSLHITWRQVYRNLTKILYPQAKDRAALEEKLDVKLPKDAEIFDAIDIRKELFDIRNFNNEYEKDRNSKRSK